MNKNIKRIVLAGGSGFLGKALAAHFSRAEWEVVVLSRSPKQIDGPVREVAWDARSGGAWEQEMDEAAAVVNLTGKSVNCRYTASNRKEILESRVNATRAIGAAISRCSRPPDVWLNASTATLYKHTLGQAWDESGEIEATHEAKDAFSVAVGKAWEAALDEAQTPGTRKIAMRMAMVLGMDRNSVFPVLRRLVRFGLGGKMGSGEQYVSWMHVVDYCRAIEWLINHDELCGAVNVVAPNPVPNREMMKTLREIYHIPFGLPATGWMLELGAFFLRTETEFLIKSRRVIPGRLVKSGFQFQFCCLRHAFADLAKR